MNIKSAIKTLLPTPAVKLWTNCRLMHGAASEVGRDPEDIFNEIYKKNRWGGKRGQFYSGTGSDTEAAQMYVEMVREFVINNEVRSLLDIGCGDFRVGQQLVTAGIKYIGADIVAPLIDHNIKAFGSDSVQFVHLDAIKDVLPNAELCLVRQVLQHLSNDQISIILEKLANFKFVLISEHHPAELSQHNLDKPAGAAIRAYKSSGVYLEKPPFSRGARILLETPVSPPLVLEGEKIVTYLLTSALG